MNNAQNRKTLLFKINSVSTLRGVFNVVDNYKEKETNGENTAFKNHLTNVLWYDWESTTKAKEFIFDLIESYNN